MGVYSEYLDKNLDFESLSTERKKQLQRISSLRDGGDILVYAADLNKSSAAISINYSDVLPFNDQLANLKGKKLDFITEDHQTPSLPPLLGNTFLPPCPVHSAPQWNRPDPTNATSTACHSLPQRCTVCCRQSVKGRSEIFRQWGARSKPISLCWQARMSHCA